MIPPLILLLNPPYEGYQREVYDNIYVRVCWFFMFWGWRSKISLWPGKDEISTDFHKSLTMYQDGIFSTVFL